MWLPLGKSFWQDDPQFRPQLNEIFWQVSDTKNPTPWIFFANFWHVSDDPLIFFWHFLTNPFSQKYRVMGRLSETGIFLSEIVRKSGEWLSENWTEWTPGWPLTLPLTPRGLVTKHSHSLSRSNANNIAVNTSNLFVHGQRVARGAPSSGGDAEPSKPHTLQEKTNWTSPAVKKTHSPYFQKEFHVFLVAPNFFFCALMARGKGRVRPLFFFSWWRIGCQVKFFLWFGRV